MCGICGLLAPSGAPDPALVERMNAALVHRGPDEGSVDAFGRCVLGHRRLQVIDLATGSQPVANESGDVVAVFNGELYNFRELRAELAGHEVRGSGDTPVIPHLYEESGPAFVSRVEGMFTIALWDAGRERLVLARDRVGKKPLLWTRLPDGTLAFASELKALLRLPGISRELDPAALDAYLALQYVPTGTALRGVEKLPPGHLLVAEGDSVRVEPYWSLEPRADELRDEEWLERVRETVGAAVRRRLVADVPLGALLSGGIDSSVVVAEMAGASRAGADVHRRVRRRPVRRARLRPGRRRALRHGARGDRRRAGRDRAPPAARARLRRAARRRGGAAAVRGQRAGAAARDRRAHRRRRRRGVRRVRAVRGGRAGGPRGAARGRTAARVLRWAGRGEPRSRANRAGRLFEVAALPSGDPLRAADGGLPGRPEGGAVGAGVRGEARACVGAPRASRTTASRGSSASTCARTSPATCSSRPTSPRWRTRWSCVRRCSTTVCSSSASRCPTG